MDTPRNLTPERGPSVWDKPPGPSSYWPIVALAAVAVAAGVAWRYRSFGKALVVKGAGLGGMVLGFATSPAGRRFASILMERWSNTRRPAEVVRLRDGRLVDDVDDALEDTFPASDPPALTYRG
jgi:hypothetical protein